MDARRPEVLEGPRVAPDSPVTSSDPKKQRESGYRTPSEETAELKRLVLEYARDTAELKQNLERLTERVEELEADRDRLSPNVSLPECSQSPGVSNTSQPSLLPGRHPVSVLKEFCDRMYWAAPKYEMVETRSSGFVFQACLEPPATTPATQLTPSLRRLLKAVDSVPCPTHKKAKESAAHKLITILQGAGIRV